MDFSSLIAAVNFDGSSLAVLAIAALMMVTFVIRWGVGKVLEFLDGEDGPAAGSAGYGVNARFEEDEDDSDPYDGYTAADDARDRAAAGLGPNPHWDESARLHN